MDTVILTVGAWFIRTLKGSYKYIGPVQIKVNVTSNKFKRSEIFRKFILLNLELRQRDK